MHKIDRRHQLGISILLLSTGLFCGLAQSTFLGTRKNRFKQPFGMHPGYKSLNERFVIERPLNVIGLNTPGSVDTYYNDMSSERTCAVTAPDSSSSTTTFALMAERTHFSQAGTRFF